MEEEEEAVTMVAQVIVERLEAVVVVVVGKVVMAELEALKEEGRTSLGKSATWNRCRGEGGGRE